MMIVLLSVLMALLLDKCFGEPKRFHPLVGFGRYVDWLESRFNQGTETRGLRLKGCAAVAFAVGPWLAISFALMEMSQNSSLLTFLISAVALYLAIGWQSLLQHAKQVAKPLAEGDLTRARQYVAWIVSRDTEAMDETQVAKAATESVLENGADAIFAAIFWFCLLGVPGVVLYRCSNTLDAMWGYKNERFHFFGWAAARLDDVLNYLPARCTALSYAMLGHTRQALVCWRTQGYEGKSPNAGPVMASGAGALNISLGGAASYHHRIEQKPLLGPKETDRTRANADAIEKSCQLINRVVMLWVALLIVLTVLMHT